MSLKLYSDDMSAATLLREARNAAGLTQVELAARCALSQPVIARLERPGSNPTLASLERVLRGTGHQLQLVREPAPPVVDETQIAERLRLTPAQRLSAFNASQHNLLRLAAGARRVGPD